MKNHCANLLFWSSKNYFKMHFVPCMVPDKSVFCSCSLGRCHDMVIWHTEFMQNYYLPIGKTVYWHNELVFVESMFAVNNYMHTYLERMLDGDPRDATFECFLYQT